MKKNNLLILLLVCSVFSFGQSVNHFLISNSGDVYRTGDIELTFTIGEAITETFSAQNLFLTQGFLQTYNNTSNFIPETYPNSNSLSVYPNPASDFIITEIENCSIDFNEVTKLLLIDINGKLIKSIIITESINKIDVADLPSGTYLLKLVNSNLTKVFHKINK